MVTLTGRLHIPEQLFILIGDLVPRIQGSGAFLGLLLKCGDQSRFIDRPLDLASQVAASLENKSAVANDFAILACHRQSHNFLPP